MIIRVYLDGSRSQSKDVTIDGDTTSADVVLACRGDSSRARSYYLAEVCMGYERAIDDDERPLEILQQWGGHSDKVQFFIRQTVASNPAKGQNRTRAEKTSDVIQTKDMRPDLLVGTELSVEKLIQIATKQKERLNKQQKMLTKKSQQFLTLQHKQQKYKDQLVDRNERLTMLRDRINEKEAKLKKLKLLKSLVQEQGRTNAALSKELEITNVQFENKEHELASIVDKMENLTKQWKGIHQENPSDNITANMNLRNEKLQKRILECNFVNERNSEQLQQKREILVDRHKQITEFEEKIYKLRARLFSNQQKNSKAAARKLLQVVSGHDDMMLNRREAIDSFLMNSHTKYKTLPHSLKFNEVELPKTSEMTSKKETQNQPLTLTGSDFDDIDGIKAEGTSRPALQRSGPSPVNRTSTGISSISPVEARKERSAVVNTVNDKPSVELGSNRHLLMNHFSPRPYDGKYTTAKSNMYPVVSPSDQVSVKGSGNAIKTTAGQQVTESTVTKSVSDSYEILITDPPMEFPGHIAYASKTNRSAAYGLEHKEPEQKTGNLEVGAFLKQLPSTSGSDRKTSAGHVVSLGSDSKKQNISSSEVSRPLSDLPSKTVSAEHQKQATINTSTEEAVSALLTRNVEKVAPVETSKENTGKSKAMDARYHFFQSSALSTSPNRKCASFDETTGDSSLHLTGNQMHRTTGSFHGPASVTNASKNSSNVLSSPKSSKHSSILQIINAKFERSSSAKSASPFKADASSHAHTKSEPTNLQLSQNTFSKTEVSSEASAIKFPWSSKIKSLAQKPSTTNPAKSSPCPLPKSTSPVYVELPGLDRNPSVTREIPDDLSKVTDQKSDQLNIRSQKPTTKVADSSDRESKPLVNFAVSESVVGSDYKRFVSGVDSVPSVSKQGLERNIYDHAPNDIRAEASLQTGRTGMTDTQTKNLDQRSGSIPYGKLGGVSSAQAVAPDATFQLIQGPTKTEVTAKDKFVIKPVVSTDMKTTEKPLLIASQKKDDESAVGVIPPEIASDLLLGLDLERPTHKPIIPRPVRRRMSSGDMSEIYHNKVLSIKSRHSDSSVPEHVSNRNVFAGPLGAVHAGFQLPSGNDHGVSGSGQGLDLVENTFSRQPFRRQGNLKRAGKPKLMRRVSFEPLALLLDASLEGELDLVEKTAREVPDISASNDEGITALHNAICAGHLDIVQFLVAFGCDVNSPDSDGWTPLHCAASCNNLAMSQFLVEHGACIFATTFSDQELASDKCEEDEEGFDMCCQYLRDIQEKTGIVKDGVVYAVFDYEAENSDELSFRCGDRLLVLRKGDECEQEWWWSRLGDNEGYVPRNLVGLYPRVVPQWRRCSHPST